MYILQPWQKNAACQSICVIGAYLRSVRSVRNRKFKVSEHKNKRNDLSDTRYIKEEPENWRIWKFGTYSATHKVTINVSISRICPFLERLKCLFYMNKLAWAAPVLVPGVGQVRSTFRRCRDTVRPVWTRTFMRRREQLEPLWAWARLQDRPCNSSLPCAFTVHFPGANGNGEKQFVTIECWQRQLEHWDTWTSSASGQIIRVRSFSLHGRICKSLEI